MAVPVAYVKPLEVHFWPGVVQLDPFSALLKGVVEYLVDDHPSFLRLRLNREGCRPGCHNCQKDRKGPHGPLERPCA